MTLPSYLSSLPLEERYSLVGHYQSGFQTGEQPDFIAETTTGGGSVSYETADGGRARLATGTSATGDGAELVFGGAGGNVPVSPDEFDAVVLTVLLSGTTDGALVDCRSGFRNDASNRLYYLRDSDTLNEGGDTLAAPERSYSGHRIMEHYVIDTLNDGSADEAYSVVGGMPSQINSPVASDTGLDYEAVFIEFRTADTTADRGLSVYFVAMDFFELRA